jgi:hypothetical protein
MEARRYNRIKKLHNFETQTPNENGQYLPRWYHVQTASSGRSRETASGRLLPRPFCQSASTYGLEKVLHVPLAKTEGDIVRYIHCAFHNLSSTIEGQTGDEMVKINLPFHLGETHPYTDLFGVSSGIIADN